MGEKDKRGGEVEAGRGEESHQKKKKKHQREEGKEGKRKG